MSRPCNQAMNLAYFFLFLQCKIKIFHSPDHIPTPRIYISHSPECMTPRGLNVGDKREALGGISFRSCLIFLILLSINADMHASMHAVMHASMQGTRRDVGGRRL